MDIVEHLKVFSMTNLFLENDLSKIEKKYNVELKPKKIQSERDESYYPQFEESIKEEAKIMADHYEIFYCLEKSIRNLICEAMEEQEGESWWSGKRVNSNLKTEVAKRIKLEKDSAVTPRSNEPLDFTTFGELAEIIVSNWDIFGAIFNSQRAIQNVMNRLNTLRGPIAHCSPFAEDEVLRLQLSLRDWFRLME